MQTFVLKDVQRKLWAIINFWQHKWRRLSIGQNNKTTVITALLSVFKTNAKIEEKSV